jgi:hypothetical protein
MKKLSDSAESANASAADMFTASRMVVSLIIGFIAGVAAALAIGIDKLLKFDAQNVQLLLGIAAAGYVGTDFIEAFAGGLAKVPPPKFTGFGAGIGTAPGTGPAPGTGTNPPVKPAILRGDGSFPFTAEVVNDDIVARGVRATWFGGPNDPSDSGQTASGVSTRDNPNLLGCALPMDGFHHPKTDGSPIPRLPWRTLVRVRNLKTDKEITVPLIDLGPSKFAQSHAVIDLTETAFNSVGARSEEGVIPVDFSILGGARFVGGGSDSTSISQSEGGSTGTGPVFPSPGHGPDSDVAKPPLKAFIASPNFNSRNGTPIDMIVMHFTDGSTAQGAINRFLNPAEKVSAHYIIERNGDIYQMVQDTDRAWHAKTANSRSIGIEHVAVEDQQMAPAQEQSSVALIRWLMATYNIPKSGITGHRFAPGNIGTTDCPHSLFGPRTEEAVRSWVDRHFA